MCTAIYVVEITNKICTLHNTIIHAWKINTKNNQQDSLESHNNKYQQYSDTAVRKTRTH